MGVLAQQVALTTDGITRMIDRMIAAGLVDWKPSPSNGRVQFVELTKVGKAKLDVAAAVHAATLSVAFAGFNQRDITTLDELLDPSPRRSPHIRAAPVTPRRCVTGRSNCGYMGRTTSRGLLTRP